MIINTYGFLKNETGKGTLILLRTLQEAGFNFKICYVGDKKIEDFRNFEIFCSAKPIEQTLQNAFQEPLPDLTLSPINTDTKPLLEYANAKAAKRWRYSYLRNFIVYR